MVPFPVAAGIVAEVLFAVKMMLLTPGHRIARYAAFACWEYLSYAYWVLKQHILHG